MSDVPQPADTASDRAATRRILAAGLLRSVLSTAVVLVLYFWLPLDGLADMSPAVSLPILLAAFAALVVLQVRAIFGSTYPGLRALEGLGVLVPLFLVAFAGIYYVLGVADPSWFSEPLSRLDALYFTVTVFATVGFGDITSTSAPARAVVTLQMVVDLLVIGLGVRVILGAVQEARRRAGRPFPTG